MCGIAGYFGKKDIAPTIVNSTLDLMKRRGPDGQQAVQVPLGDRKAQLLHSRLSIIDLDDRANQPFQIGPYTLCYNGELYNYKELKSDLESKGIQFNTTSDTEVLLQSYIHYGMNCFDKFEGMWALALVDQENERFILSRDRFGEKPLYIYHSSEDIYFGSQIKFLAALRNKSFTPNQNALFRYLTNGYKSLHKNTDTFFEDVFELEPGTNWIINTSGQVYKERYWKLDSQIDESMTLDDAIVGFRDRLFTSVKLRLRADVPVAFCLSGGVDSSALVSIAAKEFNYDVATYSIIDEDERYNEEENVRATVQDIGCKNQMIPIPKDDFFGRLSRLIDYHDSPISTISYYIHSLISEAVHNDGFKVVVSGTAADELVSGYYDHFILHLNATKGFPEHDQALKDWQTHILPIIRNPCLRDPDLYEKNPNFREHVFFKNDEFASYLKVAFKEEFSEEFYTDDLMKNRMMNELFHESVPPILHEDDLNSMYYSLENRSPFLDRNLTEYCFTIPNRHLIKDGYAKYILRQALEGILNDQVRLDRKKKGFNASFNSLVDTNSDEVRDIILGDGPIFDLIRKEEIEKAMNMDPLPNSFSKFLFSFVNAKLFLEQ